MPVEEGRERSRGLRLIVRGARAVCFYRKDRKDRNEHPKGHRIFDPSHHRTEKPQIAQMDADLIAPSQVLIKG